MKRWQPALSCELRPGGTSCPLPHIHQAMRRKSDRLTALAPTHLDRITHTWGKRHLPIECTLMSTCTQIHRCVHTHTFMLTHLHSPPTPKPVLQHAVLFIITYGAASNNSSRIGMVNVSVTYTAGCSMTHGGLKKPVLQGFSAWDFHLQLWVIL